jgi:hypothetical protein
VAHAFFRTEAAGVIHTDFEKGFIRAETVAYADLVEFGSHKDAKDAGKVRAQGDENPSASFVQPLPHSRRSLHRCARRARSTR